MIDQIVGTVMTCVARVARPPPSQSSRRPSWKPPERTSAQPLASAMTGPWTSPSAWASTMSLKIRELASYANRRLNVARLANRLPRVMATPVGAEVVPEVNRT